MQPYEDGDFWQFLVDTTGVGGWGGVVKTTTKNLRLPIAFGMDEHMGTAADLRCDLSIPHTPRSHQMLILAVCDLSVCPCSALVLVVSRELTPRCMQRCPPEVPVLLALFPGADGNVQAL